MPAWPDPRAISVGIAWGSTPADDPTGLVYETISPVGDPDTGTDPGPVLESVEIDEWRTGDAPETAPTAITLRLRNDGGEFSPQNVTGPYYGQLRPGTWVQVSIDLGSGPQPLATAMALDFIPSSEGAGIDSICTVPALGLLNKLARDTKVLSALARTIRVDEDTVAYWPLEDGSGTQGVFASGLPGGTPLSVTTANFAAESGLGGAASLPVCTAATVITGSIIHDFGSGGVGLWSVSWVAKFPAAFGVDTVLMEVGVTGANVDTWRLIANGTTLTMAAYLNGVLVASKSEDFINAHLFEDKWAGFEMFAIESIDLYGVHASTLTGITGVLLETLAQVGSVSGSINSIRVANLDGVALGHIAIRTVQDPPWLRFNIAAVHGYPGETATDRIERLLAEARVAHNVP